MGLALVGLVAVSCNGPVADPEEAAPRVVPVEVVAARSQQVVDRVVASGSLGPLRGVDISAQTAGTVVSLKVQLGDPVRRGQLLARVDAQVARAQLQQAEANLRAARARASAAATQRDRTERLAEGGASSEVQLGVARVEHEAAAAGVESAAATVALTQDALRKTRVVAPWAGTIAAVHLEVGSLVGPGQPAFRLVDVSRLQLRAGVGAAAVQQLHPGQEAKVFVAGDTGRAAPGEVTHVGPEPDPRSHTYPVEIAVGGETGWLRPGMVGRVEIAVGSRPDAVVIPRAALTEGAEPHVFVVDGEVAHKRSVTVGQREGSFVEIEAGLRSGEQVVTLGRQHLADGTAVRTYTLGEGSTAEPEAR
jgi:membrane fusion protein (multidrug efflux system)